MSCHSAEEGEKKRQEGTSTGRRDVYEPRTGRRDVYEPRTGRRDVYEPRDEGFMDNLINDNAKNGNMIAKH